METPRPILDVENLEVFNWPKRDWSEFLDDDDDLYWRFNAYRVLQKHMMITYKHLAEDDDPKDPDPYSRYYIFYCLKR